MSRSYDTASLVTLPRLDASGADAIVTELLSLSSGEVFLKTLRKVHKEYGDARGITTAKPSVAAGVTVKEPLDAVRAALRTYALMVLAHTDGEGDPEADGEAHDLLAPLVAWQWRPAKGKAVVDPSEPAQDPTPAPTS